MEGLVKFRNWLLLAAVVTLVVCIPIAKRLTFDQTIESFFPPDNQDIQLLLKSRQDFGGDEFVIVAWQEPGLIRTNPENDIPELSAAATSHITEMSQKLSELPGIDKERTRDLERFLRKSPYNKNTRQKMLKLFDGVLIGPDQQSTAIVLQLLSAGNSPVSRGETVAAIRETTAAIIPGAAVAGEAVQIQDMFNLVERDGNILYIASLVVLSIMLLVIFKNPRWVLASVGIVIASVTCTRAVLVIAGAQLSMVSSMLNSLVTVISIGTTTHIIVYYRGLRSELDQHEATLRTLRELWHPVMWTVITIAVGFAALLVSDIVPVRSFAIMMTLGTHGAGGHVGCAPRDVRLRACTDSRTGPHGRCPRPAARQNGHMIDAIRRNDIWCLVLTAVTLRAVDRRSNRFQQELSRIIAHRPVTEVHRNASGAGWFLDVLPDVPDPI
ncbi:MAG: MMPL family transporter [Planctomycetaceae bacterium]